jgi:AAA domain
LFDVPEWIPGPANEAKAETETPSTEDKPASELPLPFINIAAWHDQPVPERAWTVKDRIPAANITLLSGEGSIGKSILALQLGTAVVLGRDWLGTLPDHVRRWWFVVKMTPTNCGDVLTELPNITAPTFRNSRTCT